MTNEILQLERNAHDCIYLDEEGSHKLRNIIHQIENLVDRNHSNEDDLRVSNEVLVYLKDAERHLDTLKPEDVNINDWKHNLQAFSRAKAAILYPLNLLKATLRFRKNIFNS